MIIKTVFNNNSVIALDDKEEEFVLFGCGIGFKVSKGDQVNQSKIEKIFTLKEKDNTAISEIKNLLINIPEDITSVTFNVVEYIKNNSEDKLSDSLYVTLMDHLNMAVELYKKDVVNPNLMMYEIKKYHPSEYELAKKSREIINTTLNIDLNEYEIGHIALHIINAKINKKASKKTLNALEMTKKIKDIINIINYRFKLHFEQDSFVYERLIYHLKFLIMATDSKKQKVPDVELDAKMIEEFFNKYPDVLKCIEKIEIYLNTKFNRDEKFYLTVHIVRVLNSDN
jgi:beta-glucoside operon transcriptional antiterminator